MICVLMEGQLINRKREKEKVFQGRDEDEACL